MVLQWRNFVVACGGVLLAGAIAANAQQVEVEDVFIDHVSTVPANEGENVELFARHYQPSGESLGAVVVPPSGTLPADVGFGLDYEEYDHLTHLAEAGFHVFAADVTGYGFSPRPAMDDPCNANPDAQAELLVPNPLEEPCEPSYNRVLTSYFSDWDELDTIVDFVRDTTGHERVSFIGWSRGGARAGGYAAAHPAKVERLVLIAPSYGPDAPHELEEERLSRGYPLNIGSVQGLTGFWANMAQCPDRIDEDLVAVLRRALNDFDPVAAEWGPSPGNLYRAPMYEGGFGNANAHPGWNREVVQQISAPTLVIRGLDDMLVTNTEEFHTTLTADRTMRLDVACGTHWLQWERTHTAVRDAIAEFLREGTVNQQDDGVIEVDEEGRFQ